MRRLNGQLLFEIDSLCWFCSSGRCVWSGKNTSVIKVPFCDLLWDLFCMCVWRRDSPRRYPEAGGDSSGSAADESEQIGRRQTAPHPVLSGRSFSVQVCPTQDAQQLRVKFLCSCYKSAEIKLEKHFVQNVIWYINEAYFTMPCMTLEMQVWKYLHHDGFNKFVHYCDCLFHSGLNDGSRWRRRWTGFAGLTDSTPVSIVG